MVGVRDSAIQVGAGLARSLRLLTYLLVDQLVRSASADLCRRVLRVRLGDLVVGDERSFSTTFSFASSTVL